MDKNQKISKPLADALSTVYARALNAREAVEHRLASMPAQEALVQRWKDDLVGMAIKNYPQHEVSSYPVQTRMKREIEKLERYQDELPKRLDAYAKTLIEIDRSIQEVLLTMTKRNAPADPLVPWPFCPNTLKEEPWPQHWPKRPDELPLQELPPLRFSFDTHRPLPPRRLPAPKMFTWVVANQEIEFESRYEDGVIPFIVALDEFMASSASSRWPAIIEAIRCGIRWPQLDRYLHECNQPWLPLEYVSAKFGLRGTLERRDELADLMAQFSAQAGCWYLSQQPCRTRLHEKFSEFNSAIEELMAAGLVSWGAEMPPEQMLREIPFDEVKSAFSLAGLPTPKSRTAQVKRYGELVAVRGEAAVQRWIRGFVDPSSVIEIHEPNGWHREARLGPRARAHVMVSALVQLHYGDSGPRQILNWNR